MTFWGNVVIDKALAGTEKGVLEGMWGSWWWRCRRRNGSGRSSRSWNGSLVSAWCLDWPSIWGEWVGWCITTLDSGDAKTLMAVGTRRRWGAALEGQRTDSSAFSKWLLSLLLGGWSRDTGDPSYKFCRQNSCWLWVCSSAHPKCGGRWWWAGIAASNGGWLERQERNKVLDEKDKMRW